MKQLEFQNLLKRKMLKKYHLLIAEVSGVQFRKLILAAGNGF